MSNHELDYTEEYNELYDYLSTVPEPREEAGLLVFGRKDPLVAHAAGEAMMNGIGNFAVISGGVGKDSGDLQVPESVYLKNELYVAYPNLSVPVFTETLATNGGENVRNSLDLMDEKELPYQDSLTSVAHGTSARRLHEMMKHEAKKRETPIEYAGGIATKYTFNAQNPADQQEATAELLRLANWPAKGWLQPVEDLPENLVDFANDQQNKNR